MSLLGRAVAWFLLGCIAAARVACATTLPDQTVHSVERSGLAERAVLELAGPAVPSRVVVQLAYTRAARSDVKGRAWSYSVRYQAAGSTHQLSIREGGDGLSVWQAAKVHDASGAFTITVASIDAEGNVPPDITLSLERTRFSSGQIGDQASPTNLVVASNGSLSWTAVSGADAYEVQWVFVDTDDTEDAQQMNADQAFSARPVVTIEVPEARAQVGLGYSAGAVHIRVRALGRFEASDTIRKGPWSDPVTFNVAPDGKLDEARTWWRSTSFDSAGTSRTTVRHYDSLLRERQLIATSAPDGVRRITQTVLDDEGRTALTTLPIPVNPEPDRPLLAYDARFYGEDELSSDKLRVELPESLPPALAPGTRAGTHFRVGNGEVGRPEEVHPYSTTLYGRDFRARPKVASGIGTILHQHPTNYLYGTAGIEFARLFGSTAGLVANYSRDVITDPNGQSRVRYSDSAGRIVALGLVGSVPSTLQALPEDPYAAAPSSASQPSPEDPDQPLSGGTLEQATAKKTESAIEIPPAILDLTRPIDEYTHMFVNAATTTYTFGYTLNSSTIQIRLAGGQRVVCPRCKYDVSLAVYGRDGQVLAQDGTTLEPPEAPSAEGSCKREWTGNLQVTLSLPGEYKFVRRIALDASAIDTYIDQISSNLPGSPNRAVLKGQLEGYAPSECKLQNCSGNTCQEMVRTAVSRQCDALEATARADMQARGVAANYTCPSERQEGESSACCHVRFCRQSVSNRDAEYTLLWQIELGKFADWDSANVAGMLDPVVAGVDRPDDVNPCTDGLCRDWEGSRISSQILGRMLNYRINAATNQPLTLWDYVRQPQFGFDSPQQWAAFKGAYLALRAEELVASINQSRCPYNDLVPEPDLSSLNASGQAQEQAALVAFAEHCAQQCAANVCNWRWQLSDRCSSYKPFDTNADGRNDFPAYVCGSSTPVDAVATHLTNYCLRQCGLQNQLGSISRNDLATDPDLVAARQAAGCALDDIAGSLIRSEVVCLEDCDKGFSLTACGRLIGYYLANRLHLENDPTGNYTMMLRALAAQCPEAGKITERDNTLVVGGRCRLWMADRQGNRVALDRIGDGSTASSSSAANLDAPVRSSFTGLVLVTSDDFPIFVMSDCGMRLTEFVGPCCEDGASKPLDKAPPGSTTSKPSHGGKKSVERAAKDGGVIGAATRRTPQASDEKSEYACTEGKPKRTTLVPQGSCSHEMLSSLQALLTATGMATTIPQSCVSGIQRHGSLVEFTQADGKRTCWLETLAGSNAQPWAGQSGAALVGAGPAVLPLNYPRTTSRTVGRSEIVLRYTGIGLTIEDARHRRQTVYVYGSCPLLMGPECTPVSGEFALNLQPFNFYDWKEQCQDDAAAFQSAQVERIFQEGQDAAAETIRTGTIATCMGGAVSETLTVTYRTSEYAHTLYYYDQVGNLTAVVPPEGVRPLPFDESAEAEESTATFDAAAVPAHEMLTRVRYDARNNVVWRSSPDAGETQNLYDLRGRKRFSQTAEQAKRQDWSYAKYDKLDRIVERGVIGPIVLSNEDPRINQTAFPGVATARREVVTWTHGPALVLSPSSDVQRQSNAQQISNHLRGRVRFVVAHSPQIALEYGYSPSGQIRHLSTDVGQQSGLGKKTARYLHDPVDDALLAVDYQVATADAQRYQDEFRQRYEYDSERRLAMVSSSIDDVIWNRDARYDYYTHGPTKRVTLGEDEVQGVDFVHTIQGWLKAVNAGDASSARDPGQDGLEGGLHSMVPQDLTGLLFTYFNQDFVPASAPFMSGETWTSGVFAADGQPSLYSGIVRSRVLKHRGLPAPQVPVRSTYRYDQMTRLVASETVTPRVGDSPFATGYTYDLNGNIATLKRTGPTAGACAGAIDELKYSYASGKNWLLHIKDEVDKNACDTDIDTQGDFLASEEKNANYGYDAAGRLTSDIAEQIKLGWSATDKVLAIHRAGTPSLLEFAYDGLDRRAQKITDNATTYYVRHPDGRILATYERRKGAAIETPIPSEFMLYAGSKRLGTRLVQVPSEAGQLEGQRGLTRYELVDQVGSVLALVSDQKVGHDDNGDGVVDRYTATVTSAADYYPFGMLKPGQEMGFSGSRFGFAGYEKDDEVKGIGSIYVTQARFYDSQNGRWWGVDPQPSFLETPYGAFKENPINFVDPLGMKPVGIQGQWPMARPLPRRVTGGHIVDSVSARREREHRSFLDNPKTAEEAGRTTPGTGRAPSNPGSALVDALKKYAEGFSKVEQAIMPKQLLALAEISAAELYYTTEWKDEKKPVWAVFTFKKTLTEGYRKFPFPDLQEGFEFQSVKFHGSVSPPDLVSHPDKTLLIITPYPFRAAEKEHGNE